MNREEVIEILLDAINFEVGEHERCYEITLSVDGYEINTVTIEKELTNEG